MNAKTTRNVREKAEKVEKTIRKATPLTKIVLISLGLLGGLYCADKAYTRMSEWRNDHKIIRQKVVNVRFELKLNWPYRVEEVKESSQSAKISSPNALQGQVLAKEVSPHVKTEFETVMGQKHGSILWNIYQLETQRGKTDHCRITGKGFGGFGVMYAGEIMCYPTFEKAVERAEFWLSKMEPDKNLVGALCLWNTGVADQVNCQYYQSYLSL